MNRKGLKRYKESMTLSSDLLGIITGMLLGDAWVMKNKSGYCVAWEHKGEQKQYTEYKLHLLYPLCLNTEAMFLKNVGGYRGYTLVHPMFTDLRYKFYKDRKKIITREVLEYLNAPGLACWFMDDGWAQSTSYKLATNSFTLEEHHLLREFLREKFGIYTNINIVKYKASYKTSFKPVDGIGYNLYLCRRSVQRFEELIGPFICPSMEYKFKHYLQNPQRLYAELIDIMRFNINR